MLKPSSHETYSLRLDVRFRRFRIDGRTSLPSIRSVEPVIMPGSASGLERLQDLDGFRRLRTDRVVRVHFGCTDDSFPVDHVPRGHGNRYFASSWNLSRVMPKDL